MVAIKSLLITGFPFVAVLISEFAPCDGESGIFQRRCLLILMGIICTLILESFRRQLEDACDALSGCSTPGECLACPLAADGPKFKLVVKLDLARFQEVKDRYARTLRGVSSQLVREDECDETELPHMEHHPDDVGVVIYTAFLCGCASRPVVRAFVNDLLAAADSVVSKFDHKNEDFVGEVEFDTLDLVGNDIVYMANGSSILECIHMSMRSVARGFLMPGPHGKYIPHIRMYTLGAETAFYMARRIKDIAWGHSTDLTVPYTWFMHSKDGVWHLQDVFRVKVYCKRSCSDDQLWNVFHY